MKVRAPLHSIDVRGRFGVGPVFSIWKGQNYARVLSIPINPQTERQLDVRGYLISASRSWALLNDGQRNAWENYAEAHPRTNVFGQEVTVSGFNEYVAMAVMALDLGETPLVSPPEVPAPSFVTDLAGASGAEGEVDVTWTAGQGGFVDVWIAGPVSAGRKSKETDYRHNVFEADEMETVTIENLVAEATYDLKVRQVFASGQVGPFGKLTATAGAAV